MTAEDFATFWQNFPRKIGKLDAAKAYTKARTQASAAELLDGVRRYIEGKPDYADWCHPASWLRAGRWMDEYDAPVIQTTASDWWEDCKVIHGGTCDKRWNHETKKRA